MTTERTKYLTSMDGDWESLEPEHGVPFLRDNIEWRVVDLAGNVKTAQEVIDTY